MKIQKEFEQGRRDFLRTLGIGGGALLSGGVNLPLLFAKDIYPANKVEWICYTKPGGGFDMIARNITPFLGKYLKEVSKGAGGGEIVFRNIVAAGGIRAYSTIYHAQPDGYTIGDFNIGSYCESMFSKSDIDYYKYSYLLRTGISFRVIATNKNGFKSWAEMVKAAKGKELKLAVGSYGAGNHILAILFNQAANMSLRPLAFPGTAESLNAVLRGDVEMCLVPTEAIKPLLEAGELRVLAVFSDRSDYPGVPSLAQLGYPELAEAAKLHRFIFGPPNIPGNVKDILIAAFKKVFNDREFLKRAKLIGFDPDPLYGAEAEGLVKKIFSYYDKNASVIKKGLA